MATNDGSVQHPLNLAPNEKSNATRSSNAAPPAPANGFDPIFTQMVINATGPKTSPRLKEVMPNFIRHLHDFCRESRITVDEWMAAVELV